MNGILAQMLSLVTYGNGSLKTGSSPVDYYPENAAFKFCNTVNFLHLNAQNDGQAIESIVAIDPLGWFDFLKNEGCHQLKMYYHPSEPNELGTPDHKLAGFVGGGGTWLIEAIYSSHSDFWASRWEANQPENPDRNIWAVNYGRTVSGSETINFCPDVDATYENLKNVLTDIEAFAIRHELDNWSEVFSRSKQLLISNSPAEGWYKHLIAKSGYSEKALQLIYSAMSAHVFGGMGSWNDIVFDTEDENKLYDDLSSSLYDAINRSLVSGINSISK